MEQTAIDKALDVLEHLRDQPQAAGVTEIAQALTLPKSSTHRLVSTLLRRGLLERGEGGRYRLGIGLVALAQAVAQQDPVVHAGRTTLQTLAATLGETCFFVAARGERLVVIDKIEGPGVLRVSPEVGAAVPPGATASGKLYRALAPDALPAVERRDFTPATLTEDAFAIASERAGVQGHAWNRDEWIEGLTVVAVPVICHGVLAAALSVAIPTGRVPQDDGQLLKRVQAAADSVGRRMEAQRPRASQRHAGTHRSTI